MNKNIKTPKYVISLAQKMRRQMTPTEKILWDKIKGKQLGVKFRRQHPIGRYILDFYCFEKKLCIEIDGSTHNKIYDKIRDEYLKSIGINTYRFTNNDVYNNIDLLIKKIQKALLTDKIVSS